MLLFVVFISDFIKVVKPSIKVENANQVENLKAGDTVKLEITMIIGDVIKEITTYSRNGEKVSSKESARYYLIPYYQDFDTYLLTVKLGYKEFYKAEIAMEAYKTYQKTKLLPTDVIFTFFGVVTDMNDDEKKYVPMNIRKYMDLVYVKEINKSTTIIMTVLGLLFAIGGVFLVVRHIQIKKKESEKIKTNVNNINNVNNVNNVNNEQVNPNLYV